MERLRAGSHGSTPNSVNARVQISWPEISMLRRVVGLRARGRVGAWAAPGRRHIPLGLSCRLVVIGFRICPCPWLASAPVPRFLPGLRGGGRASCRCVWVVDTGVCLGVLRGGGFGVGGRKDTHARVARTLGLEARLGCVLRLRIRSCLFKAGTTEPERSLKMCVVVVLMPYALYFGYFKSLKRPMRVVNISM